MYNKPQSKSAALGVAVIVENLRILTTHATGSKSKSYQDKYPGQSSLKKSPCLHRNMNRTKSSEIPPNLKWNHLKICINLRIWLEKDMYTNKMSTKNCVWKSFWDPLCNSFVFMVCLLKM